MKKSEEPEENKHKYSIFWPKSASSLTTDYPELKKILEPYSTQRNEVLFAWFYACKASPIIWMNEETRIKKSLHYAYRGKMGAEQMGRFMSGDFGPKVINLVKIMQTFEPGPRIRAKMMVEKIMTNLEAMVDEEVTSETFVGEDGKTDFSKKKAYVETQQKIASSLDGVVRQLEGGFSVEKVSDSGDELESFMDDWHDGN